MSRTGSAARGDCASSGRAAAAIVPPTAVPNSRRVIVMLRMLIDGRPEGLHYDCGRSTAGLKACTTTAGARSTGLQACPVIALIARQFIERIGPPRPLQVQQR